MAIYLPPPEADEPAQVLHWMQTHYAANFADDTATWHSETNTAARHLQGLRRKLTPEQWQAGRDQFEAWLEEQTQPPIISFDEQKEQVMQRDEAYPSKWFRAESDLVVGDVPSSMIVTITAVRSETFPDGTNQRVLSLAEYEKDLGLNATNWDSIKEITGQDDDDNWVGHQIELFAEKVNSPRGRMWGTRVRRPTAPVAAAPSPVAAAPVAPPTAAVAPAAAAPVAPAPAPPAPAPAPVTEQSQIATVTLGPIEQRQAQVAGQQVIVFATATTAGRFGTIDPAIGQLLIEYAESGEQVNLRYVNDANGQRVVGLEPILDNVPF